MKGLRFARLQSVHGNDFTQTCISILLESSSVIGLEKLHCTVPTDDSGRSRLVEFLSGKANMKELELVGSGIDHSEPSDSNFCKCDQQWMFCVGNLLMRPDLSFLMFSCQASVLVQHSVLSLSC